MTTPLEQYDFPDIDSITQQAEPLRKSETIASLQSELTHQKVPFRDTVTPNSQKFFPEEYELETDTGLVKTSTIASVKGSSDGITKEKLDKAVERNKKELEKSNKDGAWKKLKSVFSIGKEHKGEHHDKK